MIRLHYISWAGYALIAFMVVPIIKAQSEVIKEIAAVQTKLQIAPQTLTLRELTTIDYTKNI